MLNSVHYMALRECLQHALTVYPNTEQMVFYVFMKSRELAVSLSISPENIRKFEGGVEFWLMMHFGEACGQELFAYYKNSFVLRDSTNTIMNTHIL